MQIVCLACLQPLAPMQDGSLPICATCWQQLTPAERCKRWEAHYVLLFVSEQRLLAGRIAESIDLQARILACMEKTEQAMRVTAQAGAATHKILVDAIAEANERSDDGGDWYGDLLKKNRDN